MLGNRIQRARKALGLTLRELGNKVNLSHAAIKKYEDNQVIPSSGKLIKLAKALHVKVEYFFRPSSLTLDNIQYRNHANLSALQRNEIKVIILDQIERRIEIENILPNDLIKQWSLDDLPFEKIKQEDEIELIAEELRNRWNLGLEPIPDLVDVLEKNGIKVFAIDNPQNCKFDGLIAFAKSIPIIVIAGQHPGDRQRFTLAHELGHLILSGRLASHLNEEKCCNRFAGAFLLPKKPLITLLGTRRNNIEYLELSLLKQDFGISMASILHRAEECKIILTKLYTQIRKEFDERGWLEREPGAQYPQEEAHFFKHLVFRALAEEYITESKAAELMSLSLESLKYLRALEPSNAANS